MLPYNDHFFPLNMPLPSLFKIPRTILNIHLKGNLHIIIIHKHLRDDFNILT